MLEKEGRAVAPSLITRLRGWKARESGRVQRVGELKIAGARVNFPGRKKMKGGEEGGEGRCV